MSKRTKTKYYNAKKCIEKSFEEESGPLSSEEESSIEVDYMIEKKFGFKGKDSWVIYTKQGCGYCENAKNLMKTNNFNFNIISGENNKEILEIMKKIGKSDFKTWPKIFKNNNFIGGYNDLKNLLKQ